VDYLVSNTPVEVALALFVVWPAASSARHGGSARIYANAKNNMAIDPRKGWKRSQNSRAATNTRDDNSAVNFAEDQPAGDVQ